MDGTRGEPRAADLHRQAEGVSPAAGDAGYSLERGVVLGVEFSGGSAGVDAGYAGIGIGLDFAGEPPLVQFSIVVPRRDQRGPDAWKREWMNMLANP